MDGILGGAFCSVVLPELRRLIEEYIPLLPRFDRAVCSEQIVLERGVTRRVMNHTGYDWTAALSVFQIGDLIQPRWTVLLRASENVSDVFVGVGKDLVHSCSEDPLFYQPTLWFAGTRETGRISCNIPHTLWNPSRSRHERQWCSGNQKEMRVDFKCDLEKALIQARYNGGQWFEMVQGIPDLASYHPSVEFYRNTKSSAQFLPLLD